MCETIFSLKNYTLAKSIKTACNYLRKKITGVLYIRKLNFIISASAHAQITFGVNCIVSNLSYLGPKSFQVSYLLGTQTFKVVSLRYLRLDPQGP
jgi:hypothetical protein